MGYRNLTKRLLVVTGGAMLLVVAAGPDSGSCVASNEPVPVQCTLPADCEGLVHALCVGDWQCVNGACDWDCGGVACASDAECDDGDKCTQDTCTAGVCAHPQLPGCGSCETGADCSSWEQCVIGTVCPPCYYQDPPCLAPCYEQGHCQLIPGYCWSDKDCQAGQHCEGAIICPPGAMCFVADQAGKCVAGGKPCSSSSDCPKGEFCTIILSSQQCCPPGALCGPLALPTCECRLY